MNHDQQDLPHLNEASLNSNNPPLTTPSPPNPKTNTDPNQQKNTSYKKWFFISFIISTLVLGLTTTLVLFQDDLTTAFFNKRSNPKSTPTATSPVRQMASSQSANPPQSNTSLTNPLVFMVAESSQSAEIKLYNLKTQEEQPPNNTISCTGQCRVTHLTRWSPDGKRIGIIVFDNIYDFENQRVDLYQYQVEDNQFQKLVSKSKKDSITTWKQDQLLTPGLSFWSGLHTLETTSGLLINFDAGQIKKSGRTTIPVLGSQNKLIQKYRAYAYPNATFTFTNSNTNIEQFQGFFGPRTVFEATYAVAVEHQQRDLKYKPTSIWQDQIVGFKPSGVRSIWEAVGSLNESNEEFSEAQKQAELQQAMGPTSAGEIYLEPLKTQITHQTIIIPNEESWISAEIFPQESTNNVLVLQSTDVQSPSGVSRIIRLSIEQPQQFQVIKEISAPFMHLTHPVDPQISQNGNHFLYGVLVSENQHNDPLSAVQVQLSLINIETRQTKTLCRRCNMAQLYNPYELYRVDYESK